MADIAIAFLWHQHQPYYPDDVGRREPHALGAPARRQGLLRHGPAPAGSARRCAARSTWCPACSCSSRPTPSAAPPTGILRRRRACPADGLSEADCLYLLDHFFMANPDHMIRPYPRYHELLPAARPGPEHGPRGAAPLQRARPPRPAGLVQPGLDPSAGLRAGRRACASSAPRAGTSPRTRSSWLLDKQLEILRADHSAAPRAGRARPGRADDDAVLSSDPAAAVRQEAGPRGDAGRQAAALHGRLSRGRRGPRPPGRRAAHAASSAQPPRGMWPAEGSVCQAMIPLLAEHGIRWIATDEEILEPVDAGLRQPRRPAATSAIPSCSIGPTRSREGGARAGASSSAITP